MIRITTVLCISILPFFLGCSRKITSWTFPAKEIIPADSLHTIDIHGGDNPIRMLYMGCGHLIIQYNQEMIITDPYFSVQPFSLTKKIHLNSEDFQRYRSVVKASGLDMARAKSVWIAHTHYDHMMDIPKLLSEKILSAKAAIYGNEFGDVILQKFISPGQYHVIRPEETYNPKAPDSRAPWIDSTSSIRVFPIRSDHAPHMKLGPIKFHLMKGKIKGDYFKTKFTRAEDSTRKKEWREGCVYSFLVDFMSAGKIDYRLFIQTSASHFPLGRPPEAFLKDHPVDVAVLCLASSNMVKPYPVDILTALRPKKTIFIHWEDFFERAVFNNYRLVRLTNFRKISKRMIKYELPLTKDKFVMPRPGTLVTIR